MLPFSGLQNSLFIMGRLCFRWNMLLKQSNWAPLPSGSRHRKGWVNVLHFASWSIFVHQGDPCHKKMSTKVILDIKIVPQGDPGGWKENHLATDGTNLNRWGAEASAWCLHKCGWSVTSYDMFTNEDGPFYLGWYVHQPNRLSNGRLTQMICSPTIPPLTKHTTPSLPQRRLLRSTLTLPAPSLVSLPTAKLSSTGFIYIFMFLFSTFIIIQSKGRKSEPLVHLWWEDAGKSL